MNKLWGKNKIYLVTSQEYSQGKTTIQVAEEAIAAGVDIIQLREKTFNKSEIVETGRKLSTLCQKSNILFIVNDDPHLAKEVGADGVHLGQEDIVKYPVEKTRKILGQNKLIGLSTHSLKEANRANNLDINYIAFGPVFETKTKNYFIGTRDIQNILDNSRFPVFFIGGINTRNIKDLLKLGANNFAFIREITQSSDINKKVKELKNIILAYKKEPNESKN